MLTQHLCFGQPKVYTLGKPGPHYKTTSYVAEIYKFETMNFSISAPSFVNSDHFATIVTLPKCRCRSLEVLVLIAYYWNEYQHYLGYHYKRLQHA